MGLVCEYYETGEPYLPEKDLYINPEDGFDDICSRIHGITKNDVEGKLSFADVWADIEPYFTNTVIVGHNVASADLDALAKALHRYNIDVPEIYYICTMQLAKEYIPRFAVENYSMTALCNYFDIDMDSEHNAFDDACANADLFKALVEEYSIDVEKHIKKYEPRKTKEFTEFVASPVLRKSISEFYGIIRGFSIDDVIEPSEAAYIAKWREENAKYSHNREIDEIITVIDEILQDGKVTVVEIVKLQQTVKGYLDTVSTSPVTLATQILNGIMQGIIVDNAISEAECNNLRQWLYDNIHLSGHYPFDKIISTLEEALSDGVITAEESIYITSVIEQLLNPVETLKTQVNSVNGKSVCLSGVFSYGSKADVEKYIIDNGGSIDKSVKKTTDILLIGNEECQAYANGTYGTKIKKTIEYNENGCHIQIIKESDFLKN